MVDIFLRLLIYKRIYIYKKNYIKNVFVSKKFFIKKIFLMKKTSYQIQIILDQNGNIQNWLFKKIIQKISKRRFSCSIIMWILSKKLVVNGSIANFLLAANIAKKVLVKTAINLKQI